MFYPCCKDIKNRQNLSLDLADCENNFKINESMNRMRFAFILRRGERIDRSSDRPNPRTDRQYGSEGSTRKGYRSRSA